MWDDRQLPDTDIVYRKRESSPSPCLFAFLVFAALIWAAARARYRLCRIRQVLTQL